VIKNHLRSTFDKLGVWSRLELAMYVANHGGKVWPSEPRPGVESEAEYSKTIAAQSFVLLRLATSRPALSPGREPINVPRPGAELLSLTARRPSSHLPWTWPIRTDAHA
jgi:hypothetical protein